MSINPNDVAKLMQNLNMNAAKSTSMTTGVGSMRKSSFNYSRRSNDQDDSEEDEDEYDMDDDEIDEDEVLEDDDDDELSEENDVSEDDTNTQDKSGASSGMAPLHRKVVNITPAIETIKDRFSTTNQRTETDIGDTMTEEETHQRQQLANKDGRDLPIDYDNFELDEDIDSENLISDEEDDNESGFLSQI